VIPARVNRRNRAAHDRAKYNWRNLIERLFSKLKNWRRVATRYDKPRNPASASSLLPQSNSG
jgi:transposase